MLVGLYEKLGRVVLILKGKRMQKHFGSLIERVGRFCSTHSSLIQFFRILHLIVTGSQHYRQKG
jgi:hypothetical protein